jgi:hypothetical protein
VPRAPFSSFLERSLAAIASEVPGVNGLLCERLGRVHVRIVIDGERVVVRRLGARIGVLPDEDDCSTEFRADRATLLDLVHARSSFLDAVVTDRIELRGPVDELLTFYDALHVYLQGAVRSPSLPSLLAEFTEG